MGKKCPACGKIADGRFCSQCGARLEALDLCGMCGNQIPPGGRFCNMCGTPATLEDARNRQAAVVAAPVSTGRSNLPWYVASAAILVALALVVGPRLRSTALNTSMAPPAGGGANPAAIDLDSMTPEEAALRLYNRVMRNLTVGDSAAARAFAPMAISAYSLVRDLDADGHYHVALLHLVNDDAPAARREADAILQQVPTHLFGLYLAAYSEEILGNDDLATPLYSSFLANYGSELAAGRLEYGEHAEALASMRDVARKAVGDPL